MISIAWMQEDEEMQRERNMNADPEIAYCTHSYGKDIHQTLKLKLSSYAIMFLYFKGGERK